MEVNYVVCVSIERWKEKEEKKNRGEFMMTEFEKEILIPFNDAWQKSSSKSAFYIQDTAYSYLEFVQRISAIRREIQLLNTTEQIFALAIHDDIDTYASVFALWMEGKSYVPLHPNQPQERNLGIISQVGLHYVIDSNLDSLYKNKDELFVIYTANCKYVNLLVDDFKEVSDNDLAYILFTSGSTGVPKGVQISRGNLAAFMDSFWATGISVDSNDKCLQTFDLTFDVSVQSFLAALTRGGCCYTVPYGAVKYMYVAGLIQEHGITFGAMAPSMLTYLRPYFGEFDASSMRTCILTAEACPIDMMEEWYKCAPNVNIYDFYGPTEATIYCTCYRLSKDETNLSLNGIVSIGKPLKNVKAIIVDENNIIVDGQNKGELCVAGQQVTCGYWNNKEKNEASFFVKDGERYYKTGDLCYYDVSGNIMYSGRIDQQAKIQGYRVELGEIEYHVREFFCRKKRAVAVAFSDSQRLTEIAVFIESDNEDTSALIVYLEKKLPQYMIPSRYIYVESFPLNKSEKIDRVALKSLI